MRLQRRWLTLSLLSSALATFVSMRGSAPITNGSIQFEEISRPAGVHFRNEPSATSQKYLIESMGGGVAVIDYDGDGLPDLFFVNGAKLSDPMREGEQPDKSGPKFWNRLYHNEGHGKFTDVTAKAGLQGRGYGMGVAVGDYDNDGRPDLFVTHFGGNNLYHNNGDGAFMDVTTRAGVAGSGWPTSAMFLDHDGDGYLDIVVTRYLDWDFKMNIWCGDRSSHMRAFCHPDVFTPSTTLLYRNLHNGTFADVSDLSGLASHKGNGLGVASNDFDRDGWPDIVVANDALPQQLFRNLHNGTFHEEALEAGAAVDEDGRSFSGMGVEFRDYDNDGWADIFITDLATQKWGLFKNMNGVFQYDAQQSNIAAISRRHSGWGASLADFDNDGWKDLFVAQGHVMDNIESTQPELSYLETPSVMRNVNGRFEDVSASAGNGFSEKAAWRGAAVADIDNDGSEDVIVAALNGEARIFRNRGNNNHWLTVDTIGSASNRDGIGAQVHVVSESGYEQWDVVSAAGSYLSSRDTRVHFGLGRDTRVKLLEIRWPSGVLQQLKGVSANQIMTVHEPAAKHS